MRERPRDDLSIARTRTRRTRPYVTFLERDTESYAANRDPERPPYCRVHLYRDREQLERLHSLDIRTADLVIVGSCVPDGVAIVDIVLRAAGGCTAFYDLEAPVTLAGLQRGNVTSVHRRQIPVFDLYLSATGGPTLQRLEREFGAKLARALYCSVDPDVYCADSTIAKDCDLGYLGTYSEDRQTTLDELLIAPARMWTEGRFLLAGAHYPDRVRTPPNVTRISHLTPSAHRRFYNRQRFTLNVTRRDMAAAGYSPSVRLFEAAACGTPIVSDDWPGLRTLFAPGRDILIAKDSRDVLGYLTHLPDVERARIGSCAQRRVLAAHTSLHRAMQLEEYVAQAGGGARASALQGMQRPA